MRVWRKFLDSSHVYDQEVATDEERMIDYGRVHASKWATQPDSAQKSVFLAEWNLIFVGPQARSIVSFF
jgi:hypothetical protein